VDLCPDCSAPLGAEDVVCPVCGAEFAFDCPECGAELPADADACPECGTLFDTFEEEEA
jgi:predicted amidophosphoribosyltransferase